MFHPLIILIMLLPALREIIGEPARYGSLGPGRAAWITLGGLAFIWLAGHVRMWMLGRRLDRRGDGWAVIRADQAAAITRLGIGAWATTSVLWIGWLDAIRSSIGNLVFLDEALCITPPILAIAMTWWSFYPIERRVRQASLLSDLDFGKPIRAIPTRGAYTTLMARHALALSVLPLVSILAWREAVPWLLHQFSVADEWRFHIEPIAQILGAVVVLVALPPVIRHVWATHPLEDGPLRESLMALCKAQGVRVRELLVWDTGGLMLNGAVMGLIPRLRYILLTDALLEALTPLEIQAVMAHEVGHVRRRHIPWMWAGSLACVMLTAMLLETLLRNVPAIAPPRPWDELIATAITLSVTLVIFGWMSRRFEGQADAFAVQHLSGVTKEANEPRVVAAEGVQSMAAALDAVARLNHIPRERFNWRHGSIATRQRQLRSLMHSRTDMFAIDRTARRLKWLIAAAFIGAFTWAVLDVVLRSGGPEMNYAGLSTNCVSTSRSTSQPMVSEKPRPSTHRS